MIVGDKEFSEFDLFGIGIGGGIAPTADSIFIQGGMDDTTGDYGLRFLLAMSARSDEIVNATIGFKVSVLDDYYIDGASLYLTGTSTTGSGNVTMGDIIWGGPIPDGDYITSLGTSKQDGDGGVYLIDNAEFGPVKEIWIQSKTISITGGTVQGSSAQLTEFYQFYSQTPEPATIVLLGTGLLITVHRKRSKAWEKPK